MTIYVRYDCKSCGRPCYPMDMHSKTQCKVCWLKEYKNKFKDRTYKSWETRRKNKVLLGKN